MLTVVQSSAADASIAELYNRFIHSCSDFLEGARDADMDFAAEKLDHHRFLYDKKMQDVWILNRIDHMPTSRR